MGWHDGIGFDGMGLDGNFIYSLKFYQNLQRFTNFVVEMDRLVDGWMVRWMNG